MTAASTSSGRIVSIVCLRRLPAADRNGQTLDWRITVAPFDGLNESPPPPCRLLLMEVDVTTGVARIAV